MKIKLTKEENAIENQIAKGEWRSVSNKQELIKKLKSSAQKTMLKDQRMNIRITKRDLVSLKSIALEDGIPYQTLVSGILHKFVTGRLIEK